MMSSLTERLLNYAMEGLLRRDNDLCNLAIADDEEVDSLEKEIDREGIDLLIRFHPVASDMREVIAAMKLSANLERIADQSVAIARRAKKLNAEAVVPEISLLEPVFQLALAIFRDSMHAFVDRDIELALKMKPRDRELDQLNLEISESEMQKRLAGWKAPAPRFTNGVMAKYALLVSSASTGAVTALPNVVSPGALSGAMTQ